jgi:protein SCO1
MLSAMLRGYAPPRVYCEVKESEIPRAHPRRPVGASRRMVLQSMATGGLTGPEGALVSIAMTLNLVARERQKKASRYGNDLRHPRRMPKMGRTPMRQPSGRCATTIFLVATTLMIGAVTQSAAAPKDSPRGTSNFPSVQLVTQDGHAVRFYEDLLKDKIVVINTTSIRCAACLGAATKLAQVQQFLGDRVGKDIFFYSITSDPERDTPPVLKEYAEKLHAGPGWLFLTGQRTDLDLLGRKLGLYSASDSRDPAARSVNLLIGGEATGRWTWRTANDTPQYIALTIDTLRPRGAPRQPGRTYADIAPLGVKGRLLFETRCGLCHTIGQGDGDGPDLQGVTDRRERAWLARWLAKPDRMLADGDPTAMALYVKYNNEMPNLLLEASDVEALLAYLEVQSARR